MPLEHRFGDPIDGLALGDVAHLRLAADLGRELPQRPFAPGEEDARVSLPGELPHEGGADAARRAGDDRDAAGYRHTRTDRVAEARFPPAASTTARRTCLPFFAFAFFQSTKYRSTKPLRLTPIFPAPSKN